MLIIARSVSAAQRTGKNHVIRSCISIIASGQYMRLRRDPEHLVEDIAANVVGALGLNGSYRSALREVAVANYDWERIAQDLSRALHTMGGARAGLK